MYWLLEKQGKLYFLQSSQTKGRGVLLPPLQPGFAKDTAFLSAKAKSSRIRHSPNSRTVCRFPVLPTPCAKTAKSCAFCDSLPVSASVCVFAFDTGGLGLLGGQGFISAKASLDPLCRALWHRALVCGTELRFGSLCNLGLSKKLRFSLQRHKT